MKNEETTEVTGKFPVGTNSEEEVASPLFFLKQKFKNESNNILIAFYKLYPVEFSKKKES